MFVQVYSLWCRFIIISITFVLSVNGQIGKGTVTGTVFDPSGEAVMPGVKVIAIGYRNVETTESNADGVYIFNLPSGTYQISTSSNFLYPLKREPIAVSIAKTETVNLYPSFRLKSQALVVAQKGVVDKYSFWPLSKFKLIISNDGNRYLVEFKYKKILHKVHTFLSTGFERVKMTKGTLTVLGRQMTIDRKGQIKVVGNVLIDDNGQRTQAESHILP